MCAGTLFARRQAKQRNSELTPKYWLESAYLFIFALILPFYICCEDGSRLGNVTCHLTEPIWNVELTKGTTSSVILTEGHWTIEENGEWGLGLGQTARVPHGTSMEEEWRESSCWHWHFPDQSIHARIKGGGSEGQRRRENYRFEKYRMTMKALPPERKLHSVWGRFSYDPRVIPYPVLKHS